MIKIRSLKEWIINALVFLSIFVGLYIGETIGPNKVGFWCNDESIRHAYIDQIIDFRLLLTIVLVVPTLLFVLINRSDSIYNLRNYHYGLMCNLLITLYCKTMIGRPRPNFHATCKPAWYSTATCSRNDKNFISNYTCKNPIKWLAKNSNQSFYSGHSCLSTYAAMFIILYLNDKLRINGLLKAHLLFFVFLIGLFPGFTQYINFWHFASDVLVGDLIGILLALFIYYGVAYFDNNNLKNSFDKKSGKT